MADIEDTAPPVDVEADEPTYVSRPETAGTEALEGDAGADEDGSQPEAESGASDDAAAAGVDDAESPADAQPDATPEAADRPPSAAAERPASAAQRPPSAPAERPASAAQRPPSAAVQRPPSGSAERPASAVQRPPSAAQRPPSGAADRPASATVGPSSDATEPADKPAAANESQAAGDAGEAGAKDAEPSADDATKVADDVAGAPPGEAGEGGERPTSTQSHHPDVITDIETSPEARAEVDEMAQQQAREVIRSRQNSAAGERPKVSSAGPEAAKRRSSASNASVRSAATPPARQAPAESLANMSVQPPSPSKIKSGPWLSGTYRLPKSGKVITGEELCDALERMTNAYIDKYTTNKDGKDLVAGSATVYNTKRLSHDEYDSMISRLYKPKDRNVPDSDRIQLVTLKFGDDGQEQWQPVKQVSAEEQQAYMCQLYERCLENRKKTQEELAAKYLKPLGAPRKR